MTPRPDYPEALERALRGVSPLGRVESVALPDAEKRLTAAPILADRDQPPFNRATMDGYAVRAAEVGRLESWPVLGTVAAGHAAAVQVPAGHCIAIATGAPLPSEVDTVIPHELSDRANPVRFSLRSIERGHAVHPRGSDARQGATVIERGTVLQPHHLGIAASVGATWLDVAARPQTVILTSGDEVVDPASSPRTDQVRNANTPLAIALLRRMGAHVIRHAHVADERDAAVAAVGAALRDADLVVTVGGVGAGDRDHFPVAFVHHAVTTSLSGAAIQPGGPVTVGRAAGGPVVVGLPGNPVSVLACTHLFIWPLVRVLLGLAADLPWRDVVLAGAARPNPSRRAFRPAVLRADGAVVVPRWSGSGDLVHTAPTHGLLELPPAGDPLPAGTGVRFLPWA